MGKFKGIVLVSDMDGTLLNSEKKISKEDLEAIRYFKENGGIFTIATGRMVESARRFIEELEIKMPIVLYNGSKVYDYENNKEIKSYEIEEERKKVIGKILSRNYDIGIEIYSDEKVYILKECRYTGRFLKYNYDIVYNVTDSIWEQKWTKILLIGEPLEIDKIESEFSEIDSEIPIRSGDKFLEIVPKYTSKGKALMELLDELNLKNHKLVSVGDNMNDKEMLESSNYGFVIKSGNKTLLKDAKYIAPSNDENPIEYIVKWIEENII